MNAFRNAHWIIISSTNLLGLHKQKHLELLFLIAVSYTHLDVYKRQQDEQLRYWKWAVIPALDQDTGIITLETKAYSPEMAQKIAAAVLARSEALVNTMNLRAREDAVSLAQSEVQRAEARVRKAQEAMRNFRDAHTLLDQMCIRDSAKAVGAKAADKDTDHA